jgi:hypothetical protein
MKAPSTSALSLTDELESLVPVSLHGLARMQDSRTGLFSVKALLGPGGELINRGAKPLYTAASVVGLLAHPEGHGEPYASRASAALDALLRQAHERDPAVLGTTLWGCVLAGHPDASRVATRIIEVTDQRLASSMQLGLALAGLARWLRGGGARSPRFVNAAQELAAELRRRFLPRADVFAAAGRPLGQHPGFHAMTSFASQVYPVLGLCELALVTDANVPNEVARACDLLVESQGRHGQWWWFYSTRTRKVIEGYPVYSVHQDAMAPMALLPASRLLGKDYGPALIAGLRWVSGDNELGDSLVDREAGLIYRAIQRRGGNADGLAGWSPRQRRAAFLAALTNRSRRVPTEFELLRECRSYHLGWQLLAAAMARETA